MAGIPHTTRLVLRAIDDLTALETAFRTKIKTDKPGEQLKIRKVIIDVANLVNELEGMAERVQGKSGSSLEDAKVRLQREAKKRRSGQLRSKDKELCVENPLPRKLRKADGADHSGAMVAFFLNPDEAKKIAVDGGEPAEDLHITLAYFEDKAADRDDWDRAAKVVAGIAEQYNELKGHVAGHGRFTNDDSHISWASVDIPGLDDLRHNLVKDLEAAGFGIHTEHSFTPHITIKYLKPDEDNPCEINKRMPLNFRTICFTKAEHREMFDLREA